jgi:hypothetical protein
VLEYYFSDDRRAVFYRYTNCVAGFNLPLALKSGQAAMRILPTDQLTSSAVTADQTVLFDADSIKKMYYIGVSTVFKK